MCIYTLERQTFFKNKKIPQGGCATPTDVLKLDVSGVKDTAIILFLVLLNNFENNFYIVQEIHQ